MRGTVILWVLLFAIALPAHETGFPEQTLKKVFPGATGFTTRKKTLTVEQLKRVEKLSGSKVAKNDNPLTFYVALGKTTDGSGVLGMVVMVDAKGPKGAIDLAIGVNRDASLNRVVVVENGDDPGLASDGFLNQLKGKTVKASLSVGQDVRYTGDSKAAQALLSAVRRALFLLDAAAGGK